MAYLLTREGFLLQPWVELIEPPVETGVLLSPLAMGGLLSAWTYLHSGKFSTVGCLRLRPSQGTPRHRQLAGMGFRVRADTTLPQSATFPVPSRMARQALGNIVTQVLRVPFLRFLRFTGHKTLSGGRVAISRSLWISRSERYPARWLLQSQLSRYERPITRPIGLHQLHELRVFLHVTASAAGQDPVCSSPCSDKIACFAGVSDSLPIKKPT
jgi:hypothetical protein